MLAGMPQVIHRRAHKTKKKSTSYPQRKASSSHKDRSDSHRNGARSSSQQGPKFSPRRGVAESLYRGGKVDKSDKLNLIRDMDIWGCEKIVRNTVKNWKACPYQVFADVEVARNMVRRLKELGIGAWVVEECTGCGLIHVIEQRKVLTRLA